MSGYYVGPFGQPGDNPYQLPPPRPATLQFGSDPFLRQRQQAEPHEQGRNSTSAEVTPQQLPSVRSLLTPVSGPTSPPSYHQPFSAPPHIENREQVYPYRQHESRVVSPVSGQDRVSGRSEALTQQPYTPSLPPLSQVAMTSPREMIHHSSRSDPLSATMLNRQLPLHAATAQHEAVPSGELSSPESGRSQGNTVLPHVVDEKYIDGEGFCFVYADGSHVPKSIDGIPVNANWGVTKAGKPRKRLAQACLTCREKKIKCQPNLPKCDQCQKSGRECRFESAPRGIRSFRGSQSTGASGHDGEDFSPGPQGHSEVSPSIYNMGRASESATSLPGTSGQSPISEGTVPTASGTEGAYETDADKIYRARGYRVPRHYSESDYTTSQLREKVELNRRQRYAEIIGDLPDITPDDPLADYDNIDPYADDPEMTLHYVESFFSNVNDSLYYIFPHARFVLWLRSCYTKSPEDKMLLYAILALGSIFSERPDRIVALKRNYRVARFAIQKSQHKLSLQLVQSHIVMSLLYFAGGYLIASWDSIGSAARAVSGLRYNMESGGVVVDQNHACDFGLHPQALMECRRRTFWVTFILDRVSTFFLASSTSISSESVLIRLPCREETYEAQQYATAPYFQSILNQATLSAEGDRSSLSTMAYLVQILSIWSDVSHHTSRLSHTPPDRYAHLAEEVHTATIRQTEDWTKQLPEDLVFSALNLERACQTKKTDAFVSMHMLYHATLTKLYRHVRYQSLRSDVLIEYVHRARYHAVETLRIAVAAMQYAKEFAASQASTDSSPKEAFLNPFLGHIIMPAVDVLSAAGLLADLPNCVSFISGALDMIQTFGRHWDATLDLAAFIQKRLDSMAECLNDRVGSQDKLCFTLIGPSLEKKVQKGTPTSSGIPDDDVFYGTMPRESLLRAMRVDENSISEHSIVRLRDL